MKELRDVLGTYLVTKATLKGKARNSNTADQLSLRKALPDFFESILVNLGRQRNFKVEGSFGNGVIASIPWVSIFNRNITESAQNGYYIVLLFSEDMGSCYLSLNQGFTSFEKQYSRKFALQKIKEAAAHAISYLASDSEALFGAINLSATGHLGQGYEQGAVKSYCYKLANLPTPTELTQHLKILLHDYDVLISVAGGSLKSLAPINEAQYQQSVLEKANSKSLRKKSGFKEQSGGLPIPEKSMGGRGRAHTRNPFVAAYALELAMFKCEIDSQHQTFTSSAKRLPYIEAHHLIPMSQQGTFPVSLDVSANIVALCPNCHRLLHHGRVKDKMNNLQKLFKERKLRLVEKEIVLNENMLLTFYSKDLLEEEA